MKNYVKMTYASQIIPDSDGLYFSLTWILKFGAQIYYCEIKESKFI